MNFKDQLRKSAARRLADSRDASPQADAEASATEAGEGGNKKEEGWKSAAQDASKMLIGWLQWVVAWLLKAVLYAMGVARRAILYVVSGVRLIFKRATRPFRWIFSNKMKMFFVASGMMGAIIVVIAVSMMVLSPNLSLPNVDVFADIFTFTDAEAQQEDLADQALVLELQEDLAALQGENAALSEQMEVQRTAINNIIEHLNNQQ